MEHEFKSSSDAKYAAFPVNPVRKLIQGNCLALNAVVGQVGASMRAVIGWSHAQTLFNREQQVVCVLLAISELQPDGSSFSPVAITNEHQGQTGIGTSNP